MKKLLALTLALLMLLPLVACGSGDKDPDNSQSVADLAEQGKEHIEAVAAANGVTELADYPYDDTRKSTLNSDERYPFVELAQSLSATEWQPYNRQDAAKQIGIHLIYETLLEYVGPDTYECCIAKEWKEEDDTHVLVTIYDNVYDSDGNHITADDVVFSYQLNVDSGYAYNFDYYESIEKVDEYTVRLTWNAPLANLKAFRYLMANVSIISEKAYKEHDFSRNPVGTGPYVLTDYITDAYAEFEVNENYWQKDESLRTAYSKQNAEVIRLDFVTDASMRMIQLQNNTSICNPYLQPTDIDSLLEGGEYEGVFNMTTCYQVTNQTMIANTSEDSIMNDINMRLACWYAIDSNAINAALGSNAYVPTIVDACSSIGDYQDSWNDIESYQTTYDPDLAKEYLKKANYNGETITILSGTWDAKKKTAQVMQGMLQAVGINCEIYVVEFVLQDSMMADSTAWDIFTHSAGDADYTINRLYTIYAIANGKVEGLNAMHMNDPVLESMLQECVNPETYSIEKTEEILRYLIDNAYSYSGCYQTSYMAWNKDVAKPMVVYGTDTTVLPNCLEYYLD